MRFNVATTPRVCTLVLFILLCNHIRREAMKKDAQHTPKPGVYVDIVRNVR